MRLRFLAITLALVACSSMLAAPASGQAPAKVHRIGLLAENIDPSAWRAHPVWKAFFAGLAELGYVEGKSLVAEFRSAEGRPERLPHAAKELVATGPDVIVVVVCGELLNAVRGATQTIPVVVATCNDDMVASGIVASLARPGGNITGQQKLAPELSVKRLELLKQAVPRATRVAVLWNPAYSDSQADWRALRSAAATLQLTLLPFEARSQPEYGPAFAAMAAQRVDAIFTFSDTAGYVNARVLAELATKHRLPAIYPFRETALAGGLMAYGPSIPEMFRSTATYVDKILRGARPAELPIAQPTKFDFVINLQAAKALGLTIPQSLLLRADEVIE